MVMLHGDKSTLFTNIASYSMSMFFLYWGGKKHIVIKK